MVDDTNSGGCRNPVKKVQQGTCSPVHCELWFGFFCRQTHVDKESRNNAGSYLRAHNAADSDKSSGFHSTYLETIDPFIMAGLCNPCSLFASDPFFFFS